MFCVFLSMFVCVCMHAVLLPIICELGNFVKCDNRIREMKQLNTRKMCLKNDKKKSENKMERGQKTSA